jgi:hypothetical protein
MNLFVEDCGSIGEWEKFSWGHRMTLTNSEIEMVLAKIEIRKQIHIAAGAVTAGVAGAMSFGTGAAAVGIFLASGLAQYEMMKADFKANNRGNGVIAEVRDFPSLTYYLVRIKVTPR